MPARRAHWFHREAVNGSFEIYVSQTTHPTNAMIRVLTMVSTVLFTSAMLISPFGSDGAEPRDQQADGIRDHAHMCRDHQRGDALGLPATRLGVDNMDSSPPRDRQREGWRDQPAPKWRWRLACTIILAAATRWRLRNRRSCACPAVPKPPHLPGVPWDVGDEVKRRRASVPSEDDPSDL